MNTHNRQLVIRLKNVIEHLEMSREDAEDDFHGAIAHAEIAFQNLRSLIEQAKDAKVEG